MLGRHILLVNPWVYDFAAYDMWAKPLGLLRIGAVLQSQGLRVSYVDCLRSPHPHVRENAPKKRTGGQGKYYREVVPTPERISDVPRSYARYGISIEAFEQDLASIPEPDAILVTSLMTYWYPGVVEAIRILKETYGTVPVILGGIYATLCPDHAVRFSGADHVIAGEGEVRVPDLLARLWGADAAPKLETTDPGSHQYPLFELVEPLRYVCIQTSRGCPYRCSYCASHLLSDGVRRRDPVKVADEVEHWAGAYGISDFAFYDDALLHQAHAHALPLMGEVIARGLEVNFHCPNALHARCIDQEIALAMKQSGFATIRLGLETSNPERQKSTGGKVTNDEFLRAAEHLDKAGFELKDIGVYILCGLPGQHAEEVFDAVRFVKEAGAKPMIAEYSPLPGTGEWEEACRASRYPLPEDPLYHNNTLLPCAWEGLTYEMYRQIRQEARR